MFKTRLLQNKETMIALSVGIALVFWGVFNMVILVPKLIEVYMPAPKLNQNEVIDVATMNKAIDYLHP